MQAIRNIFVRPLDSKVTILVLMVIALNLVDIVSTLHNLDKGAVELNPLMAALLGQGALSFVVGKYVLASLGLIGLAASSQAPMAYHALRNLAILYSLVAVWQTVGLSLVRS